MSTLPAFDFALSTVGAAAGGDGPPETPSGAPSPAPGETWVSTTCRRCSGSLLPVLLLVADGRRLVMCSRCRRFQEVPRG